MTTLAGVLRRAAHEAPDRTAAYLLYNRQSDQAITYRRLIHGAAGYAQALSRAGIRPGEVVVLILQHGEALFDSFFGAVLHGAIPSILPFLTEKLSPGRYRADLRALIAITRPAAVITYPEFVEEARAAAADTSVRAVLVSSQIRPASDLAGLPDGDGADEDIVLLQHSSGTTGLQKGVALSHRAVLNQLECYSRAIRLTEADVIVSWLPLYHDMGLIAGFIMPLLYRAPLVLMSPFDWVRAPQRLLHAVTRYRGTLTWLPNFAYNFCAQKIRDRDLEGADLSSWRAVINCSEPMHWRSHELFRQRFAAHGLRAEALATCYAMAENVFAVTQGGIDAPVRVDEIDRKALLSERHSRPAGGDGALKMLSAGRALANVQVRVLDDERRDLPERRLGEIALRSDCMLTGYYNRPDAAQPAFHDGWYLTGDLGYLADGELYVTGRKKELIIVGGKNIYPDDLERLAMETPGVHPGRVAAFGVFNEETGTEDVVLVAEADTDDPAERRRIADEVRAHVTRGSDVALRQAYIVDPRWLLKTSSGKVARLANRDKYLAEIGANTL